MIAQRLRVQDGFTVVMAMIVLLVALLLTTAAIAAAMSSQDGVRRDGNAKRALQGANAGIEATVQRLSTSVTALASSATGGTSGCLQQGADLTTFTTVTPISGQQWCSGIVDQVGAHETATTYVSTDQDPNHVSIDERDLVTSATATDSRVPRRVHTTWSSFDARQIFRDYTVFSDEQLSFQNTADVGTPEVHGNAGSNGDIDLSSNQNSNIWGDATPGPGGSISPSDRVDQQVFGDTTPLASALDFPPVTITDAMRATNDNAALCGTCSASHDPLPSVTLGADRTITGNTFVLCSLTLQGTSNATFTFTAGVAGEPVRIYIDAPSRCGSPANSFSLENGATIVVNAPALELYVVGDPNHPEMSPVSLANNFVSGVPMTIYAPDTDVTASNNGVLNGGIVGSHVLLQNRTDIVMPTSPLPPPLDLDVTPGVKRGPYTECTPDETSPTTTGC